ncbi:MAG TPA: response regulator [Candidatus Hydrogenedentes bacterium]|nr:response regulator [Candidatus Hydrogenedentota bacterium]
MLLPEGMDLLHAAYPDVAVQLANRYNPDCLLIDADTGPPGGVVVEELLNNPARPDLPIALLTSDDAIYDRYRLYAASRIRKNFRKSSLLSGIYAAISRPESDLHPLGRAVLCVDDDPEVLEFMRRCLEEEGFSVKLCSDGDQALACAATQEYGVVLLDIAMPGLDGIEVCRRIKANPDLKGVKVFFVTAVDLDSFSREYQSSGADGILQKPFAANELLHLVSTNLAAGTDV